MIYEDRVDELGEYIHLVTLWKATKQELAYMKNTAKTKKKTIVGAETIAKKADLGQDISGHFTGQGQMMAPKLVQRVNVDFGTGMLRELDQLADELNISRQAVIKSVIRQGLDQHHLAEQERQQIQR